MSVYAEITNNELIVTETTKKNRMKEIVNYQVFRLNPDIEDTIELQDLLVKANSGSKKTVFIDNTNSVLYYDMKVPNIRRDKIITICKNELKSKLNKTDEDLVDYFEIKDESESEKRILVTSMPIIRIRNILNSAKLLKLKKPEIRVSYEGLENYMKKGELFTDKEACIAIDIRGNNVRSWLFESDEYVTLRTNRIRTTVYEEILDDLSDDISKLIQFQSTRRRSYEIKKIFLFGEYQKLDELKTDLQEEYVDVELKKMPLIGEIRLTDDYDYLSNIYSMGIILGDK